MITAELYAYLSGHAELTARIGQKLYPVTAKQGTQTPYVVYSVISSSAAYSYSGNSGFNTTRIQFDCYSVDYDEAKAIAEIIRQALEAWHDAQSSFKENEIDSYDDVTKHYQVTVDFIIRHGN